MKIVGGVIACMLIVRKDSRNRFPDAGDITNFRNPFVDADTEVSHHDLRINFADARRECGVWRSIGIMMDENSRVLMGKNFMKGGSRGFGNVHECEHDRKGAAGIE